MTFDSKAAEIKIRSILKDCSIDSIKFDDSTAYRNGFGITHQWFVYDSNPVFDKIKAAEDKLSKSLDEAGFGLCLYDDDDPVIYTIEIDTDYDD